MRDGYSPINPITPPLVEQPAAGLLCSSSSSGLDSLLLSAPINDIGNAEVFAAAYKRVMAFTPEWEGWMLYNGKFWESGEYRAIEMAGKIITCRVEAFRSRPNMEADTRVRALARLDASSSAARLKGVLELAKATLHKPANCYDVDPHFLNVSNGTIDLRTGRVVTTYAGAPHHEDEYG